MPASIHVRTLIRSVEALDTDEWIHSGKSLGDLEAFITAYSNETPVVVESAASPGYVNIRLVHCGLEIAAVPARVFEGYDKKTDSFNIRCMV